MSEPNDNPFRYRTDWSPTGWAETIDVTGRLAAVKTFSRAQLEAARRVPTLQKAVRGAVERRLRRLAEAAP